MDPARVKRAIEIDTARAKRASEMSPCGSASGNGVFGGGVDDVAQLMGGKPPLGQRYTFGAALSPARSPIFLPGAARGGLVPVKVVFHAHMERDHTPLAAYAPPA